MERIDPRSRSDAYGSRINRTHSPLLANVVPWISILAGSLLPIFFIATALPLVPPTGFLMLLAWRLVRPGLLPVWAGFPLGLFDDLYSGQPFGSAIFLWSATLLALEAIDLRLPWRSFAQDWFTAGIALTLYCLVGLALSGASPSFAAIIALGPQILLSILLFPLAARIVAGLDRLRLSRWRSQG
ncbi:rod shape-determining protein MreD [Qipengyuania sp. MTN3-11]|uniref:rod shape-determining protein MreD n=1 Tax=Qipengyuania sp. MTN3-11 TaxID=3056557 RepID=UPI0036F22D51